MKEKVGIATYMNNYNYGSILQAYSLMTFIRNLGYDAYILDFLDMNCRHNKKMRVKLYKDKLLCGIKHPIILLSEIKRKGKLKKEEKIINTQKMCVFKNFQKKYMYFSKLNYMEHKTFSAFVCGSDQIWKLTIPGLHYFFFLQFAVPEKRIAYAPSFGCDFLPCYNKKQFKKYVNSFAAISVREKSGVNIIKKELGIEVPQVLDPVLLLGQEYWYKLLNDSAHSMNETALENDQYILCYFLNENAKGLEIISKLEKTLKIKIVWIESGVKAFNNAHECCPTPFEFVNLVKNAAYVVTDSFHGVAFACMMNTNFYVVKRNYTSCPEQNTRIQSILEMLHLQSRIIENPANFEFEKIDFVEVNSILEIEREKSSNFLSTALKDAIKNE